MSDEEGVDRPGLVVRVVHSGFAKFPFRGVHPNIAVVDDPLFEIGDLPEAIAQIMRRENCFAPLAGLEVDHREDTEDVHGVSVDEVRSVNVFLGFRLAVGRKDGFSEQGLPLDEGLDGTGIKKLPVHHRNIGNGESQCHRRLERGFALGECRLHGTDVAPQHVPRTALGIGPAGIIPRQILVLRCLSCGEADHPRRRLASRSLTLQLI